MDLLQWGTNPWGQETLVRISWDLTLSGVLGLDHLLKPVPQAEQEALRVGSTLKAHHEVVRKADDNHIARGLRPSPVVRRPKAVGLAAD